MRLASLRFSKVIVAAIFLAIVAIAPAQTLQEYLRLRKHYNITQAAGVEALETFVGSRVLEIKGVVKGTFKVNDRGSIMLQRDDDGTIVVEADAVPDWLEGNETPARLLVRATRAGENSTLYAKLIAAAPEDSIARIDKEAARKAAIKTKPSPTASRGGTGRSQPVQEMNLPMSEILRKYASFIKTRNKKLSDGEAIRIAQGIIGFSLKYGVDARLIMAMVMTESNFNPNSTSRVGAMGLGQLMPGTAKWMGVSNAYDSIDNLSGTVKLVRTHLDQYRSKTGGKDFEGLVLTLAAYNAGSGAVKRHGGVPPYRETQNYVRKVIGLYYAFCGKKA